MRTQKDIFKEAGFTVFEEDKTNPLLDFIKENHPGIIRDNEINLNELKAVLGLPVDEKVNGYGLNFVGRNVARSKYATETEKELQVNKKLSKNFDTTQNMVLKGDNLDTLKILKSYYSGKIKCIYIDPPYNTTNDDFVYPDKFNKEEAEVLGLANLSEEDIERLEFSFSTKKSHNGWLSFMYPRLLLSRDLLREDGVIFISIDDNEQANLKLLCDEIFGEENFVAILPTIMNLKGNNDEFAFAGTHEYTCVYSRDKRKATFFEFNINEEEIINSWDEDKIGFWKLGRGLKATGEASRREDRPNLFFPIYINENDLTISLVKTESHNFELLPITDNQEMRWYWNKRKFEKDSYEVIVKKSSNSYSLYKKQRPELGDLPTRKPKTIFYKPEYSSGNGTAQVKDLFEDKIFNNPKPLGLLNDFFEISTTDNDLILDFFAGSGTTGHAVMQLNAEDGGNRKFILCQIDEPIAKDKPAYQFCMDNDLEPVISSITIERLRRAGEQIKSKIEEENGNSGMFEEDKKEIPDIGFKVFDTVNKPKLILEDGKIAFQNTDNDPLSRIYNMIFSVGIDNPTSNIEVVLENVMYKIGSNYYITNSDKVGNELLSQAIKTGKVFIDGWTASINTTLQQYKEDVKVVF